MQPMLDQVFKNAGIQVGDEDALVRLFSYRLFSAREPVLQSGQAWRQLYYIQSGLIRLFYTDEDGNDYNKGFFRERHCLWPVAPRDREQGVLFSIATIEPTEVLVCDIDALYHHLEAQGQWQRFALYYAERLLESKFQREHDLLTMKARERYIKLKADLPDLIARIPDYHLASYLGVTNVSLSRLKSGINK